MINIKNMDAFGIGYLDKVNAFLRFLILYSSQKIMINIKNIDAFGIGYLDKVNAFL